MVTGSYPGTKTLYQKKYSDIYKKKCDKVTFRGCCSIRYTMLADYSFPSNGKISIKLPCSEEKRQSFSVHCLASCHLSLGSICYFHGVYERHWIQLLITHVLHACNKTTGNYSYKNLCHIASVQLVELYQIIIKTKSIFICCYIKLICSVPRCLYQDLQMSALSDAIFQDIQCQKY